MYYNICILILFSYCFNIFFALFVVYHQIKRQSNDPAVNLNVQYGIRLWYTHFQEYSNGQELQHLPLAAKHKDSLPFVLLEWVELVSFRPKANMFELPECCTMTQSLFNHQKEVRTRHAQLNFNYSAMGRWMDQSRELIKNQIFSFRL